MSIALAKRALLPLAAAVALAACADAPAGPSAEDLELLRAATVTSDSMSIGPLMAGGLVPIGGGPGLPVMFGPPMAGGTPTVIGSRDACRFDAADGRTHCPATTFGGFTVVSSFAYFDAAGAAQAAFGPTTDRVNSRTRMTGTDTFRAGRPGTPTHAVTLTVDRRGDHTISGLTDPRGLRRNDGTSAGSETAVITTDRGTLRLEQRFVDTTTNLVLQVPTRPPPGAAPGTDAPMPMFLAPLSGRIVRVAHSEETPPVGAPRTVDVRSVTEFLAGGVARTTITMNGVTRVCTQWLGSRRPPECR